MTSEQKHQLYLECLDGNDVSDSLIYTRQAQDEKEDKTVYTISAEVLGDGVDMWLRSRGDAVKVIV